MWRKLQPCVEKNFVLSWSTKNKGLLRWIQTSFKQDFPTGFLVLF